MKSRTIDYFFKTKACETERDEQGITSTSEPVKVPKVEEVITSMPQPVEVPRIEKLNNVDGFLNSLECDPGKRSPIWTYPPSLLLKISSHLEHVEHSFKSGRMESTPVNKNPKKRKLVVDENDDEDIDVGGSRSLKILPPKESKERRKPVNRNSQKKEMVLNEDEDGGDARKERRFKILLPNGMSVDLRVRETIHEMPFGDFIDLIKSKYFEARRNSELLKKKKVINWKSDGLFLKDAIDAKIRNVIKLTDYKPFKCHILRLQDGSSDVAETFESGRMETTPVNKNPKKRKLVVDENDDEDIDVGGSQSLKILPPKESMERRKPVNRNSQKKEMALNEDEDGGDVRKERRFKILLPNGMSVDLRVRETIHEMPFGDFIDLIKSKYFEARRNSELLKKKKVINWKSDGLFLKDAIDAKIRNIIKLTDYKPFKCHILRLQDGSSDVAETFESGRMETTPVNKNPKKRKIVVDENDDEDIDVGGSRSLKILPPKESMERRKPVNRNSQKKEMALNEDEDGGDVRKERRFKILLPNGMSVDLRVPETIHEMPFGDFIDLIKSKYFEARRNSELLKKKKVINWKSDDLFLKDAIDAKIRNVIKLTDYKPFKCHILRLQDGSSDVAETFENMWDLTPDTDLLLELPEEYSFEAALADLIDNALQAVWSNGKKNRKLIRVNVNKDKISIFDNGPGMDDSDENSLVKWGKMGASLHRSSKSQAIGGKPPYLMPYFGMFGYGGPIASMHLGRRTCVSSKMKHMKKVYVLFLEREALLSTSNSNATWKTNGSMRDPSRDELTQSHGNFTEVVIYEPKIKDVNIDKLQCHLKDIYSPYIQSDDFSDGGKTITPIEFQVNGVDLTEIQGGEVAITNLHSCNGPEFVLQLHFSFVQDHDGSREIQEANARLRFVYFPFTEGKENIERVLEKLRADGLVMRENFQSFSRVSVRRLGRLLPDARWTLLPLMDFRNKKGVKAYILKRCSLRVKCFIETDAGFKPTQYKTDLAQHNPFTIALKNLGIKISDKENDVRVKIYKDGKATKMLAPLQLEKEYREWMLQMHSQYDEEADSGEDQPIIIVSPANGKELGISSDVVRVHRALKRREKSWQQGQKIKVLKGAYAGCHKTNVYATIEYFLLEGFEGDAGGEARIICRPMDIPEESGSFLSVNDVDASLEIRSSLSLPISVIDMDKVVAVESIEWDNRRSKRQQKSPASIYLMGPNHHKGPNVDEVTAIKWDNQLSKGQQRSPTSNCSGGPNLHKEPNVNHAAIECGNRPSKGQQRSTSICSGGPNLHKEPNVDQVGAIEWDNQLSKGQQRSPASVCSQGPNLHKEPNVDQIPVKTLNVKYGYQPTSPDKSIMPLHDQSSFNHKNDTVIPIINNDDKELDALCRLGKKICKLEKHLIDCGDTKAETEKEMFKLQDKLQHYGLSSMDSLLTKDEIMTKLKSMENTAASVLCNPSMHEKQQKNDVMKDIVGVVALLGSVQSLELSRMLAEYLGEEKMLGVIIRSFDTASSLERYKQNGEIDCMSALHAEAAALGKAISKRFHAICFEDIRPYTGNLQKNDPQRKLALPDPKLPNGRIPAGFMGFAVNMVDLDINHLQMRTALRHGLRETVLFSLFKELHVYKTRATMVAARACIVDGAVSLDGGIIRENGVLSLGYGNPSIYFPILNMMDLSPEAKEILKQIEERKTELKSIEETISKLTKYLKKYRKNFENEKERYNMLMDRISEHMPKILEYNHEAETGQI